MKRRDVDDKRDDGVYPRPTWADRSYPSSLENHALIRWVKREDGLSSSGCLAGCTGQTSTEGRVLIRDSR